MHITIVTILWDGYLLTWALTKARHSCTLWKTYKLRWLSYLFRSISYNLNSTCDQQQETPHNVNAELLPHTNLSLSTNFFWCLLYRQWVTLAGKRSNHIQFLHLQDATLQEKHFLWQVWCGKGVCNYLILRVPGTVCCWVYIRLYVMSTDAQCGGHSTTLNYAPNQWGLLHQNL